MNISVETKPSLQGADRLLVTLSPVQPLADAGLDLTRLVATYEHLSRRGEPTESVVEEFAQTWGLHRGMAERLLKGQTHAKLGATGLITLYMNGEELLDCYLARIGLAEGAHRTVEDIHHWWRPLDTDQRRRRIEQTLQVHARHGGHGTRGSVGGEQQLIELLRDLRDWCDEHEVDILVCISQAFEPRQ
jgi:hypothetical protein